MSGERIKFLVDVGVGRKVESWLAENGYDSKAVRDLNPRLADFVFSKTVDFASEKINLCPT